MDRSREWLGLAASMMERVVYPVNKALNALGVGSMMFVMLFTVLDVVLRKTINKPILGSYEIVEYGMILIVFFGIAYTQMEKGHIAVEMLVEKFPPKIQAITEALMYFVCFVFWVLISIAGVIQAKTQWLGGNVSATLLIPNFPFLILLSIGSLMMALTLVADLLRTVQKEVVQNSPDELRS